MCPGDVCDWVRETSCGCGSRGGCMQGPRTELKGKVRGRMRPINSAMVANQDHRGRGGGGGSGSDLH